MGKSKGGFLSNILGSAIIAALISGIFGYYGDVKLEKYKNQLQTQNALVTKKINNYSTLEERVIQFDIALNRYLQTCKAAASYPKANYLKSVAKQLLVDLAGRMADVIEAAKAGGIDPKFMKNIDSLFAPLSLILEASQKNPGTAPELDKFYKESLEGGLQTIKSEIEHEMQSLID